MLTPDEHIRVATRAGWNPYAGDTPPPTADMTPDMYREFLENLTLERGRSRIERLTKSLPSVKLQGVFERKVPQPAFHPEFETLEQISLRLSGTMIFVGEELFYVVEISQGENNGKPDYFLQIQNSRDKRYHVWYSDPRVDCRSPDPQYVMYSNRPAFFTRTARRQQQQGLGRNNTILKFVGHNEYFNMDRNTEVMESLKHRDPVTWDPKIEELMRRRAIQSLRLTDNVAVWASNDRTQIRAEYKGRYFGEISDDRVYCHPEDCRRPWIKSHLKKAGFELREKTK